MIFLRSHAAALAKATGCKGSYPLMDLPSHDRLVQTLPDMMHTLKDAVEKLYEVITVKDKEKVESAEKKLGRFQFSRVVQLEKRRRTDIAPSSTVPVYQLSPDEIRIANCRALTVISPTEFSPANIFSKSSSLKSHDWKEVCINNTYVDNC